MMRVCPHCLKHGYTENQFKFIKAIVNGSDTVGAIHAQLNFSENYEITMTCVRTHLRNLEKAGILEVVGSIDAGSRNRARYKKYFLTAYGWSCISDQQSKRLQRRIGDEC